MERRALRRDTNGITVLREQRVPLEADLQQAFVQHPDALPASDLGLGPLVSIGWELDLGAGPMDQLAVDASGQLVVTEYKKGTENPDVRHVIAQLLDYGSALWRTPVEALERHCAENGQCSLVEPGISLADHVAAVGPEEIDVDRFNAGLRDCLDDGSFVFLYIARDLDARTRRVLTYLAEGPRLRFFALEVDWFAATDGTAVLVPRVAYVPAAVAAGETPKPPPDPAVGVLIELIDGLAAEFGLPGFRAETGRRWGTTAVLGVYRTSTGVSVNLPEIEIAAGEKVRAEVRSELERLFPDHRLAPAYPYLRPQAVLDRWDAFAVLVSALFEAVARSEPSIACQP